MYQLKTTYKKLLADTITPVSVYLKVRDKYPNSLLLESSDYHANDNSFSYICCNPIASIKIQNEVITEVFPNGSKKTTEITPEVNVPQHIQEFSKQFKTEDSDFKFINNGLFGYIAYDGVRYFEDLEIKKRNGDLKLPDIYYAVYQNIIAINHFNNEAYIFDHNYDTDSKIAEIEQLIKVKNFATYN
ncbi:MAG: anthranilate synthase component I family protein, partial [Salegentibacter mishustinae]|nr:anthranilate synthase component I family protein [Salegentibacter mishustinae]